MGCVSQNNQQIIIGQVGKSPYYSTLSSQSITLPVDASNHVTDYSAAQTIFRFYIGTSEQNVDASHLTITPSSGGNIAYTAVNESGGKGVVITITNVADSVSSQLSLNIGYTLSGTTYIQAYSLTKSTTNLLPLNVLLSSIVEPVVITPNSSEFVVKQIHIPPMTFSSLGDMLEFTFHTFLNSSLTDQKSYFRVLIDNTEVIKFGYYSSRHSQVKVEIDGNNHLSYASVVNYDNKQVSFPLLGEVNNTQDIEAVYSNSQLNLVNLNPVAGHIITILCYLNNTVFPSTDNAVFEMFQLGYKHNLNSY